MSFLTRTEVAKFFRVSTRTIERWLASGLLKGHKLGRGKTALWRIADTDVEALLKKSRNKKTG
jgi:excisionase family DNA binding protein